MAYETEDYAICEAYTDGLSVWEISRKLEVSLEDVKRALDENDLLIEPQGITGCERIRNETVCILYIDGDTLKDVGDQFGITASTTKRILQQYNVRTRPAGIKSPRNVAVARDRDEALLKDYVDGTSVHTIATRYGVHAAMVHDIVARLRGPRAPQLMLKPAPRKLKEAFPEQARMVCELYANGASIHGLGSAFDMKPEQVRQTLIANNVRIRAPGEPRQKVDAAAQGRVICDAFAAGVPADRLGMCFGISGDAVRRIRRRYGGVVPRLGVHPGKKRWKRGREA